MVVADCHVHTTNSDGVLTLETLPAAARRAGVSIVAVTDHDRLHPDLSAPISELSGVRVVHGIELRVDAGDQHLDLLGYGVERTPAMEAEIERLQQDRIDRGAAIIDRVEAHLETDLPIEARPGIGRPHIARAIASVTDHDVAWAFRELIGDDGPCYVSRSVPSFERGRELLDEAAAIVGLAHPLRYPDPAAALARCASLDAVERAYPYSEGYPYDESLDTDLSPVDAVIEDYSLLPTGGSDAHDETLGVAGLDRDEATRFIDAIDGSAV